MLWEKIKEAMLKSPNQIISEENAEITYEDLVVFAEKFAEKLSGERCCAIFCVSEMAAAMGLLSCFAAGVTAVPLSVKYGELHCNKILDMIEPTAIISDMNGELTVTKISNSRYVTPVHHPALIMCTSGTTGKPKGAMLSEENILTNVMDICKYFDIISTDKILIARPLYHCAVLTGEFLVSLFKGTRILFFSKQFNPKILLDIITNKAITVFCGTPTLISMLARFNKGNSESSLRRICISGECMTAETGYKISSSFPKADIYHVYGLTEACPRVSYLSPDLFKSHASSVGTPLESVKLKIITDSGKNAKIGETGILWVYGNNIMIGYYNATEQTAKVLKDGWLCTGDIAKVDVDGLLTILGRSDDLIIRAGMNIYPQEIEGVLKTDYRVRDVLVYKINNLRLGTQIGMKISGNFSSIEEVKRLCLEKLPSFQIPSFIELLDELPRNGSGKIIRGGYND